MTTGSAVIQVVGKSTVGYTGTVVVEQLGSGLSAHLTFKDSSSMLQGMASRKAGHKVSARYIGLFCYCFS